MAVATPVLERKSILQEKEDEKHNALIGERYAQLINPENKIADLKNGTNVPVQETTVSNVQEAVPVQMSAPVQEIVAQPVIESVQSEADTHTYYAEPYLAPSGRADGEIFRADSEINRRLRATQLEVAAVQTESDEDENEDLRPTQTTIQYRTENVKKTVEEGATVNTRASKRLSFSTRDKIVIVAVVTVIVALLALIIVNSAIISGINNDINSLQRSLNSAKNAYSKVNEHINEYTSNLEDTVRALAEKLGMVR